MKRVYVAFMLSTLLFVSGCTFPGGKTADTQTSIVTETVEKENTTSEQKEEKKEVEKNPVKEEKNEDTGKTDVIGKIETTGKTPKTTAKLPMETLIAVEPTKAVPQNIITQIQNEEASSGQSSTESSPSKPSAPSKPVTEQPTLSYAGYELKWSDEFNGTQLSTADWNYETHEKGWVNSELQAYVQSDDNIYLENGKLVIKPIKSGEGDNATYTSGRINTQGKHDFIYGLFEVVAKVPQGQGFLPAFWMMPTDENLYGQWPRCGEIDAMEVLGSETDTAYGTIHYGNPHRESQNSYTLPNGTFADSYHKYSCEWYPDKINWYIDGVLYHTESDWYSKTVGQGEVSYPAPFDQPFYMILNLAVGGNWPGNPDASTDFDQAAFSIDSVKVYQKDNYNTEVSKPEKEVILRDPDSNGNYVNNMNFAVAEDLDDDINWKFMTALGGNATAKIENGEIVITTSESGTADYSVQLVQAGIPMKKAATYELSFKAYASGERTMKTAVTAPDYGYTRYLQDTTLTLTEEEQTYTYSFTVKDDNDANGRLEFNLGALNTRSEVPTVHIKDVQIKKTAEGDPNATENKTILADGNHVYNGSFQEGNGRLDYWEIANSCNAAVSVTDLSDNRRLKAVVANSTSEDMLMIGQSNLALSASRKYELSFKAQADSNREMKVVVAGQEYTANLTASATGYTFKFETPQDCANKDIRFYMGQAGTIYLDDVRIVEDTLIKNGDFSAGFAGYEVYVDSSADASYVVDSQSEASAADFTIRNTGDQDWKIQLKQNNVPLEQGKWYKLSFDAKSSLERKLRVIMQGTEAKGWAVYSGENTVTLSGDYQTFEKTFQMTAATDQTAFLSVCLAKVDEQITTQHRVCIDNIVLEEVEAPASEPPTPVGGNMLKNGNFADGDTNWINAVTSPGAATAVFENNKAVYHITNVGTADWNVQLKQEGLSLEKDASYKLTFKAISTEARTIKAAFLSAGYAWYGGSDEVLLKDTEKDVEINFTMSADSDPATTLVISMGKIDGVDTPVSDITLSDFVLVRTDAAGESGENPGSEETVTDDGELIQNGNFADANSNWPTYIESADFATVNFDANKAVFDISSVGTADYHVQLRQGSIPLIQGHTYKLVFKATSTETRSIKAAIMSTTYDWYGGGDIDLEAGVEKAVDMTFTMKEATDANSVLNISMGQLSEMTPASIITLSDFSLTRVDE